MSTADMLASMRKNEVPMPPPATLGMNQKKDKDHKVLKRPAPCVADPPEVWKKPRRDEDKDDKDDKRGPSGPVVAPPVPYKKMPKLKT